MIHPRPAPTYGCDEPVPYPSVRSDTSLLLARMRVGRPQDGEKRRQTRRLLSTADRSRAGAMGLGGVD
jgi:hypothetical protein